MRLIDADALRDSVLKWLPPDPCGQEEKEYPFETDICVSLLQEIAEAPTIEPEYSMDEWCTDCTEYDQERHCCPRFNRVIRETVDEVKANQWIPCSERLPEEYGEYLITWTTSQEKRSYIAICEGEVTSEYDYEHERFVFEWLPEDYIKAYPDVVVIAWMPLPNPYKAESEDKK